MNHFFDKTRKHFEQNLPFVIYKKPNQNFLLGFFQNDNKIHYVNDFQENGFVFCSFDGDKNILIPNNKSDFLKAIIDFDVPISPTNSVSIVDKKAATQFETLVQKGIQSINENLFQKVVLSRKETVAVVAFDFVSVFQKMVCTYPTAFCYAFFHPKIGMWFGATPEQLLEVSGNKFSTVSLAGTQQLKNFNEVVWHDKEIKEQQYVTKFITDNLKKATHLLQVSDPFTVQAGNLLHLKTIISGEMNADLNLKKTIQILHPTPAVCGLPRVETKKFILQNEKYNREFYSGFLGEINLENKTDLFVNLRCMKIENNMAQIFIGCGITNDSNPQNEWQETVNKSMTMKAVLA